MNHLRLILFQLDFIFCFCFKNLYLLDTHSAHLDFSLITLFVTVIVTFFGQILSV